MSKKDNMRNLYLVLVDMRKLNRTWRWPGEHIMGDERASVAAHTFTVIQAAQLLANIEEEEYNTVINWKQLFEKCANHDSKEVYTGDIKGPLKNYDHETKEKIEILEDIFTNDKLFSKLAMPYADRYKKILSNGKDTTIEGLLLKASDSIDLLMECLNEIQAGNPSKEFLNTYISTVYKIKKIPLKSTTLFLNYILQDILESAVDNVDLKRITQDILLESE